jgi:hypothetical protein
MIVERDGKWFVMTANGKRALSKGYDSEEEAKKRLREIEAAAHGDPMMGDAAGLAGKWIEIFRAGDYGEKGKYGREDLDKIAANYDAALHEAPAVIGHPETDSPAYAWAASLRRSGDVLEAQLAEVDPQFERLVKEGKFKKRSAALYNDLGGRGLYLRHIGFLGAQPPEVKGLKAIFHDANSTGAVEIEFASTRVGAKEDAMTKEEFTSWFSEVAEKLGLKKKEDPAPAAGKTFSEAEVKAAKETAAAEAKAQVEREFAEKQQKAAAETARKQAAANFITDQEKAGRWIPAFDKAGLRQFVESLPTDAAIEFGEGEKKQKKSAFDLFKEFFERLPKQIEFAELATAKPERSSSAAEGVRLSAGKVVVGVERAERAQALQREARKEGKTLTYAEASAIVREEDAASRATA